MSALKILIDTNVFIGLEDPHEVPQEFSSLVHLASKHNVEILVHEVAKDDIARDRDLERREISLSKFAKFQCVSKVRGLTADRLATQFGEIKRPNDLVDSTLLHALNIGVVDFLVTEDGGLHSRAQKYVPELTRRVLYVADATSLIRTTYESVSIALPFVEEVEANTIPPDDPIFESLRDGYPEFDQWWRTKCVRERRICWAVTGCDELMGIVVRKEEAAGETDATLPGSKILKICTFKVRSESRGVKLGELLLKQVLWFAQANEFDVVYLTTFPDQSTLIALIEFYGFVKTDEASTGELMFEKSFSRKSVAGQANDDFFSLACRNYPRFYAGSLVNGYVIPIKEQFHEALFPELKDQSQHELFASGSVRLVGDGPRRPGNTIRKVYLCRAQAHIRQPGSLLFFYKSKSILQPSQALTSIGVLENVNLAYSLDDLRRLTGGRSVYSERQLLGWRASQERPVKVIDFLLVGHINPPIALEELRSEGVFRGHPQSIARLDPWKRARIFDRLKLGFTIQ